MDFPFLTNPQNEQNLGRVTIQPNYTTGRTPGLGCAAGPGSGSAAKAASARRPLPTAPGDFSGAATRACSRLQGRGGKVANLVKK